MGLLNKYLDQVDKEELRLRQGQINGQKIILEGLQQMMGMWFASKLQKYGLDPSKQWTVDPLNGQIKEVGKDVNK